MYMLLNIKILYEITFLFLITSSLTYAGNNKPKGCAKWSSQKVLKMATPYLPLIREETKYSDVDTALVIAIIVSESCFSRTARSRAGALGLMQLMPATAKRFGVSNRLDAKENIRGGIRYLRFLTKKFSQLENVIAGYNAGEGAVMKYNGVPPYRETKQYITNVLHVYRRLPRSDHLKPMASPHILQQALHNTLLNTEENLSDSTSTVVEVESVNTKPVSEMNGFVKWKVSPMKAALSGFQ